MKISKSNNTSNKTMSGNYKQGGYVTLDVQAVGIQNKQLSYGRDRETQARRF